MIYGQTHGLSGRPEYHVWKSMKARCRNKNDKSWRSYGGRGIKVCARWLNSFQAFIDDMGFRPTSKHSLERIKGNSDYEPSNCKWATWIEQGNNRCDNHLIKAFGKTRTIAQWSREKGIEQDTILARIRRGWSEINAISEPLKSGLYPKRDKKGRWRKGAL